MKNIKVEDYNSIRLLDFAESIVQVTMERLA